MCVSIFSILHRKRKVTLIRSTPFAQKISHATNLSAAEASVKAMRSLKTREFTVKSIQEYHA